ncbi:hypothetical protein [Oceaniglobus roseus]|uniref:hypothetical protein n=1 Tax=Oceaniglobus roseus TaxID=1737570 RepID=UPI000C7F629A|nr:hypothetical protein [Kandeliimicrobium roseum]
MDWIFWIGGGALVAYVVWVMFSSNLGPKKLRGPGSGAPGYWYGGGWYEGHRRGGNDGQGHGHGHGAHHDFGGDSGGGDGGGGD